MRVYRQALCSLTILSIVIVELESRRFGGGGGFRFGGGSRSGSRGSLFGGSSRTSGFGGSTRYRGNSFLGNRYRVPPPRTSIYSSASRYRGSRSSSYNGFGMGLGAGMLLGYGLGGMSRPYGYGLSGYGYNSYHRNRGYRQTWPLKCRVAEQTEIIKTMGKMQEIGIDQVEEAQTCSADDDVCFGSLKIVETNMTMDSGKKETAYEVKIVKGCGKEANFKEQFVDEWTYNANRQCWTTNVKNAVPERDVTSDLPDEVPDKVVGALGYNESEVRRVGVSRQEEFCICRGADCNGAAFLAVTHVLVAICAVITAKYCHLYCSEVQ